MNITLDGFMSGPNGELDWHFDYWNAEMARQASEQLNRADTILVGRVTYKAMAKYWPRKAMDLTFPREDIAFAGMMNGHTKIVFSNTLAKLDWVNSKLVSGDIRRKVLKMKHEDGKDMIVYGSGSIVAALAGWNLVDEYLLWLHPVTLGKGIPLFGGNLARQSMELVNTELFSSGVILLHYRIKNPSSGFNLPMQEKLFLEG